MRARLLRTYAFAGSFRAENPRGSSARYVPYTGMTDARFQYMLFARNITRKSLVRREVLRG